MIDRVQRFLREVRTELTKVSWPTRNEIIGSAGVVIVVSILIAIFVGIIDFILSNVLRVILR